MGSAEIDQFIDEVEAEAEVEKPTCSKKLKPKPDLGFTPKNVWLERRIKRICRAIAEANAVHKDWEDELFDLMRLERADKFKAAKLQATLGGSQSGVGATRV